MREHSVTTLYWDRTGAAEEKGAAEGDIWIHYSAPLAAFRLIWFIPVLYWKILKVLRRTEFDVIHCAHIFLLPLCVCIRLLYRKKVIYDAYERHSVDIATNHFPAILYPFVRYPIELFENVMVLFVSGVATIDSPRGLLLRRYRRYKKNTVCVYNVPDIRRNPVPAGAEAEREKNTLIYVGELVENKGVLQAVEAVTLAKKEIPDIRLLLIGNFKRGRFRKRVMETIGASGIEQSIEIIDWLPYDEMMEHLRKASIGLALHQKHTMFKFVSKGTGRKFFTFMEASLPVIASDYRDVAQIVRETECGILVNAEDPREISSAVVDLLRNPERMSELGRNGRKAIEDVYNWEVEEQKIIELYSAVKGGSVGQ
jgi:glycosyltransferase involved in cell wall biosynthesis